MEKYTVTLKYVICVQLANFIKENELKIWCITLIIRNMSNTLMSNHYC